MLNIELVGQNPNTQMYVSFFFPFPSQYCFSDLCRNCFGLGLNLDFMKKATKQSLLLLVFLSLEIKNPLFGVNLLNVQLQEHKEEIIFSTQLWNGKLHIGRSRKSVCPVELLRAHFHLMWVEIFGIFLELSFNKLVRQMGSQKILEIDVAVATGWLSTLGRR